MPTGLKILLILLCVMGALVLLTVMLTIALLALRARIRIEYREKLLVRLYVAGVRTASLPPPPKKLRRLRTYTKKRAVKAAAKYARRPEDYLEAIRQHALYRALMQQRAQKAAQKKTPPPGAKPRPKQPESKLEIEVLLQMIGELIEAFFEGTRKGLHVHVCRMRIDVVGKDAASTAVTCGVLWAAVSDLLALLDAHAKLRVGKARVQINPDYTGEKTNVDFCLDVSISAFRVLHTLLPLIPVVLRHKDSLLSSPQKAAPASENQ